MHYAVLERVIGELSRVLSSAKTEKIVPLENGGLCFRFWKGSARFQLLLSPDRSLPRIHLVSSEPAASGHPASFHLQVRKHIRGARLTSITLSAADRVVEMRFDRNGERHAVVFELFGAASNLILTAHDRTIEAVLHPSAPGEKKGRSLLPGMRYETPEIKPRNVSRADTGGLELPGDGDASGTASNLAVETWFENLLAEQREARKRVALRKAMERELSRLERRIDAVTRDLETSERSEDFRKRGEIILANLGKIVKGRSQCVLENFDGVEEHIPLDPLLNASQNAERYFKKYKKAKAGNALLRERLNAARAEADLLRDLQLAAQKCGADELERISRSLRERGIEAGAGNGGVARQDPVAAPYRTLGFNGWDILIGKSAAGNDYITRILAKPDDLWLHAEGMPGSHVLIRNPGKREVPVEILKKAASLAAFYSRGKGSTRVAVAYTDAKYVRKPKGAKPGMVVLSQRRTVMVAPEPM